MRRIDGKDGANRTLADAAAIEDVSPGKHLPPLPSPTPTKSVPTAPEQTTPEVLFDAKAMVRSAVSNLANASTRGYMTDDTIAFLREKCPGWDLYTLHAEFERWVESDAARTPVDWQRAFIGWVQRHHEKHRHTLR